MKLNNTLVFLVLCLMATSVFGADADSVVDPYRAKNIEELPYGAVLFEHYQNHDFSAITNILVAKKRGTVSRHLPEMEALQGRLYFRYGLQARAEELLTDVLKNTVRATTRSEIYYLLANSQYQNGALPRAKYYLDKFQLDENNRFKNEWHLLRANILMKESQYEAAILALEQVVDEANVLAYAKYNQGIALLGAGENEKAVAVFNGVFSISADTEVKKSLVDKAAITLGYYFLQAKNYIEARRYLTSVRSRSRYLNKALLGIGWSFLGEKSYEKALVSWNKLAKGDKRDSAVQEALLAIPFVYQELGAYQQALDGYTKAARHFSLEYEQIKKVTDNVEMGDLVPLLKSATVIGKGILQKSWKPVPLNLNDSPENYYLQELLASRHFYATFRSYQDLHYLRKVLEHWKEQIPVFLAMIKNNREFYRTKKPQVDNKLTQLPVSVIETRLDTMRQRFNEGNKEIDFSVFATATEMKQLNLLKNVEVKLKALETQQDLKPQFEKFRLLSGFLTWQLRSNFAERRWEVKKRLQEAESATAELRFRKQRLVDSHDFVSNRFFGFDERFESNKTILLSLLKRVRMLMVQYEAKLNEMAVQELEKRMQIIQQYQLQTDLSIARLHDKALMSDTDEGLKDADP